MPAEGHSLFPCSALFRDDGSEGDGQRASQLLGHPETGQPGLRPQAWGFRSSAGRLTPSLSGLL